MDSPLESAAIITAAGLSTRFTSDTKKEFSEVDGKSVLQHVLDAFLTLPSLKTIIITYSSTHKGLFEELTARQTTEIPILLVQGGDSRQASVRSGLEALSAVPPDIVLIHDGARPWVTPDLIEETYRQAVIHGGAAPGLGSRYALKSIDARGFITAHHDREQIIEIQTPQAFRYPDIRKAHQLASRIERVYHDDTEIYSDWGGAVRIIPGDPNNIKITYHKDIPQ